MSYEKELRKIIKDDMKSDIAAKNLDYLSGYKRALNAFKKSFEKFKKLVDEAQMVLQNNRGEILDKKFKNLASKINDMDDFGDDLFYVIDELEDEKEIRKKYPEYNSVYQEAKNLERELRSVDNKAQKITRKLEEKIYM